MKPATIRGAAIQFIGGGTSVTITNCEFTKVMIGLELQTGSLLTNMVVAGCNFHNYMVWCIDIAHTANGCLVDGLYIHDNTFHDFDRDYGATNTGGPWTGYSDPPHQDGVFTRADNLSYFTDGTNINIYNNSFYDTFSWSGGTSCIFLVGSTSANIYNNVFNCTPEPNAALTINIGQPTNYLVRILNNTFCMNGSTCLYLGGVPNGNGQMWPPTVNTVIIKNNIFYDMLKGASYNYNLVFDVTNMTAVSCFAFDYNDYTSYNLNSAYGYWGAGLGYLRLGSMRPLGWQTHGTTSKPMFLHMSHGTQGYLDNLHLSAASPVASAGTNLTAFNLPGLNSDKDGNPRPASATWSIGAYQAGTGTAVLVPPAPQNLHIVPPKN